MTIFMIKGWDARKKSSILGKKRKSMTIFMIKGWDARKKSSILEKNNKSMTKSLDKIVVNALRHPSQATP